jgi:acetyltransferase-like isoleucine patch superfamily enzyme
MGQNYKLASVSFGSEPYLVEIGNHVQITTGVKFFTHGGGWVFREDIPHFDTFGKIKVGDNVYIGNNALLMPGITIGNNVIIGAGAVVTKSINDGMIVAGNPAKTIGNISDYKKRILLFNVGTKGMNYKEKKDFLLNLPTEMFIKK